MTTLDEIGFYTLSEKRAKVSGLHTRMERAEIIITDRCNFKCPYCRGLREEIRGEMPIEQIKRNIDILVKHNLRCIRFSGGEPTTHESLDDAVVWAKINGVEKIAISTNGSADLDEYEWLVQCGVNDFSISLDACCSSFADKMAGVSGKFNRVTDNIRALSKLTYVTVGIVISEETVHTTKDIVMFAHELGVADIRLISAAQFDKVLHQVKGIPQEVLDAHPILKYRVERAKNGHPIRGIGRDDSSWCGIAVDDVVIAGKYHFPCVIHMRENGNPIGEFNEDFRYERLMWACATDTKEEKICQKNCLDCIVQYNNTREKHCVEDW